MEKNTKDIAVITLEEWEALVERLAIETARIEMDLGLNDKTVSLIAIVTAKTLAAIRMELFPDTPISSEVENGNNTRN